MQAALVKGIDPAPPDDRRQGVIDFLAHADDFVGDFYSTRATIDSAGKRCRYPTVVKSIEVIGCHDSLSACFLELTMPAAMVMF